MGWGCPCPFSSVVPVLTFWVVRLRGCRARGGPCVARGAGVWRAGAAPSGVCGGFFWLVLQVRVSRSVLCRSVPRRVASCCGVLRFGVRCRGALRCGVPCRPVLGCGGSVEVSLACAVVRSAGRSVAGCWLGGAVRCGWLAGSVVWGPRRAARAGGSGRCPWDCPGGLCLGPVSSGGPGPLPWFLWPCLRPSPVPVLWPLWRPGTSPGGEGVLVCRAAVFPVAFSVGVARSPRVGVPSIPCVVSGGWWVWAGVIRTASASCLGGAGWGCASPGVVRRSLGVGRRWSLCRGMVGWVAAPAVVPSSSVPRSPLLSLPCPWVVSCPHVVSLPVPCPYGRLPLRAPLPDCPLLPPALPLPVPFPFPVR